MRNRRRTAAGRAPWQQVPRPIDLGDVIVRVREWDLTPCERAALDLLGRHPFLSAPALADLLDVDIRWSRARVAALVRRGLARVVPPGELPRTLDSRRDLLELTIRGLSLLAGYLGLAWAVDAGAPWP